MNQQLLDELLGLELRDSQTRARLLDEGRLYGDYAAEMQQVHRENAEKLARIVETHGWPGISLVGIEGCRAAWLIAQHSICTPALQRKFLDDLTKAAASGDVPRKQAAYLTDRIRFNESKPQVYGLVFDWNERGELSCEVEDPASVDERRKQLGFPALQEELKAQNEAVAAEGGKPPADFSDYKRRGREWAKSAGWI